MRSWATSAGATTNETPRAAPLREAPASSTVVRESAPALLAALAAERRENELLRARLRLHEPGPEAEPSTALRRPTSAPADVAQERIELLERRLIKLRRLLSESEERLARAGQAQESDAGVASRYRTVQGLADDAPERERKAGLMESLFLANLELQELLRGRAAS